MKAFMFLAEYSRSAGLDKILDSIRENPDNSNLLSRYVQLATDSIPEGVEAIAKPP